MPEPSAHAWFTVTDEWGTGVRYTSVVTSGFDADPRKLFRPVRVLTIKRAGWPLAAMECTSTPVVGATSIVRGGLEAPAWATRDRAWGLPELYATVPVRPIALGFAADTAVFAGVAWGVLFAARAWRRDHRARRGECTACGYSLTGVAGNCPECGGPGRFAHSDPG